MVSHAARPPWVCECGFEHYDQLLCERCLNIKSGLPDTLVQQLELQRDEIIKIRLTLEVLCHLPVLPLIKFVIRIRSSDSFIDNIRIVAV